jgi:hypothetical protein
VSGPDDSMAPWQPPTSGAPGAIWSTAFLLAPLGGTRLLALGPAVPWLACGLLAAAGAAGCLPWRPPYGGAHKPHERAQLSWSTINDCDPNCPH